MTAQSLDARTQRVLELLAAARDDEARDRARERIAAHGGLILWGAGTLGREYAKALAALGERVVGFADETEAKWGTAIDGLTVMKPSDAVERFGRSATFVVTIWNPVHRFVVTRSKLRGMGAERVVSFLDVAYAHPDRLLPHFQFDRPSQMAGSLDAIRRAFDLFADERSRAELCAHLEFRLSLDFDLLPANDPEKYFRREFSRYLDDRTALLDCGAFDGDTLDLFVAHRRGAFRQVVAVEPDPANFARLSRHVASLDAGTRARIQVVNSAVGARSGHMAFSASGTLGAALGAAGTVGVPVAGLRDLAQRFGDPDFIKFDIEGAEQDALRGGEDLIRAARPHMAVSVYHRPDDLWAIPLFLAKAAPDYSLYLRTEGDDGMGMVCYALRRTAAADRNGADRPPTRNRLT